MKYITLKGVKPPSMIDARTSELFPIPKGKQLQIHWGDSEWSFPKEWISVTRITTVHMGQLEKKLESNY